jgi:large subunit ribosomal protein L18
VKPHKKNEHKRRRRLLRTRSNLSGKRYRLTLHLSSKHVYAQLIDDACAVTVVSANSSEKQVRVSGFKRNLLGAGQIGKLIAERAVEVGVTSVMFDRGSRKYHGLVAEFADSARRSGLVF